MSGPLAGIRIIDLTTVIAGPYATQILGDMGAEVIKVEAPGGDIMRAPGPSRSTGMGPAFLNCNRNKRSLTLDLKNDADRAELFALLPTADVLIHNMRTAAAARLDLSYPDVAARNPGLIYCSIVGYGQDGPYRDRPAYDDVIQAASGWAGLEQSAGGVPRYAPTIVADKTTSLFAVSAINAALYHRARTGEGQSIEVPMFEIMASFLMVEHLAGHTFVPPLGPTGYARVLSEHRRPYRTKDGYISVLPYSGGHWRAFFAAAGRDGWANDERLGSDARRAAIVGILYEQLASCLVERTTDDWIEALLLLDIPCSPINSVEDLLGDPHLTAVGFAKTIDHPTEGKIVNIRPPVSFSLTPCRVDLLAPQQN